MFVKRKAIITHVAGSSRSFRGVIRGPVSRDTEARESQVALAVEDQVFRLNIPMDDTAAMQHFQCLHQTSYEELSLQFREYAMLGNVIPEIPSSEQIHH